VAEPTREPTARPSNTAWIDENRSRVGFAMQAVPLRDDPAGSNRIMTAGHLAEELGFDAFFLSDHPAYTPECWVHLAALAATTSRIRLGSAVNCALYRHPVMTARLATDLDNLSEGRVVLGLGAGWNQTEFAQLGLAFPSTGERLRALEEAIQIILGVWGDEPFTFEGRHFRCTGERIFPPTFQHPGPPLMVAGGGERHTLRLVAQYAQACNFGASDTTGSARTASDIARKFEVLRRHCDAAGRSFDEILRTHFTSWVFVAETDREAKAKLDRRHPAPLTDVQRITRIAGSPETVAAVYQELIDAGFEYFVVQTQDASDLESITLLATEVMPRLRPASRG
jgi:alkanesulfonate monooxygenase SsuD/methylene tetrahydromethanopterin reductase-like flavin-dependent oxidoreductase (luciferase family)